MRRCLDRKVPAVGVVLHDHLIPPRNVLRGAPTASASPIRHARGPVPHTIRGAVRSDLLLPQPDSFARAWFAPAHRLVVTLRMRFPQR
jgi:hypothetical protein